MAQSFEQSSPFLLFSNLLLKPTKTFIQWCVKLVMRMRVSK